MVYNLVLWDNFYFCEFDNALYLIDTGSPYSYFADGSVSIDGVSYKSSGFENVLMESVNKMEERYHKNIKGIIGTDILLLKGITINKKNCSVEFSAAENKEGLTGYSFKITEYNGLKFIALDKISLPWNKDSVGKNYIIDSGTNISHIDSILCANACYAEHQVKYYPALKKEIPIDLFIFAFKENDKPFDLLASVTRNDFLKHQMKVLNTSGFFSLSDLVKEKMILDVTSKIIYLDNTKKEK